MRIALLGGTGDIGEGLALRFATDTDHELTIGSREANKAVKRADDYETYLAGRGINRDIDGEKNAAAAADADIVVLAIPAHHVGDTIEQLTESGVLSNQLLVSPAVGMKGDKDGLHYNPPPTGSVTEYIAERTPATVSVAGAFHNLAADRLANLDATLDVDTLVVADDEAVRERVVSLSNEINGVRALAAGPLANAAEVESVTPLVINIARYNNELHDIGVVFR